MDTYTDLYPDAYKRMMPYAEEAIKTYDGENDNSEENLNRMSSYLIEKSGMYNDPPVYHNNLTLNDIARAILLAQLLGYDYPYYYNPRPLHPFFPIFRRSPRRGFGRDFGGLRNNFGGRSGGFGRGYGGMGGGRGRRR